MHCQNFHHSSSDITADCSVFEKHIFLQREMIILFSEFIYGFNFHDTYSVGFPSQKEPVTRSLHFLCCYPEKAVERIFELLMIWNDMTLMWRHFNEILTEDSLQKHDIFSAFNVTLLQGKMVAISQTIFSEAFSWMRRFVFWLKLYYSLFLRVQLTITQHWFR